MQDYMNKIEPKVKEAFESAIEVIKEKVADELAVKELINRINEALINYDEATFMHGYFRACAHMLPEYANIFYTAATIMIHFKYYHYNEGDCTND